MEEVDPKAFRFALGKFATGVTVVTTTSSDGEDVGVTASSFNSVSISPPLILWSLDKGSLSMEAFTNNPHFIVNVLSANQMDVSNRFARAGSDKFAGINVERGVGQVAMLPECAARFQCQTEHQYDGGDHIILVGRVLEFDQSQQSGLLFQGGRYAVGADHPMTGQSPGTGIESKFVKNYLPYLSGRCYFAALEGFQQAIATGNLSDRQYRVLFILDDVGASDAATLSELSLLSDESVGIALADLMARGMVQLSSEHYSLSGDASAVVADMKEKVMANEDALLSVFSEDEKALFKAQLRRILDHHHGTRAA